MQLKGRKLLFSSKSESIVYRLLLQYDSNPTLAILQNLNLKLGREFKIERTMMPEARIQLRVP